MSFFRGRLFAGALYAGLLFGAPPVQPPEPGIQQENHHGGGGFDTDTDAQELDFRIRQQNNVIITMLTSMAAQGVFE